MKLWIPQRKDKILGLDDTEEEWGSSSNNVLGIFKEPGYISSANEVGCSVAE